MLPFGESLPISWDDVSHSILLFSLLEPLDYALVLHRIGSRSVVFWLLSALELVSRPKVSREYYVIKVSIVLIYRSFILGGSLPVDGALFLEFLPYASGNMLTMLS